LALQRRLHTQPRLPAYYLDNKVSDDAKTAVSAWLQPNAYDKSCGGRDFDRVYTRPLFGRRALLRSAVVTVTIWLVFFFEFIGISAFF
jgi:hypothetical protein